jgi:hypothetical protein
MLNLAHPAYFHERILLRRHQWKMYARNVARRHHTVPRTALRMAKYQAAPHGLVIHEQQPPPGK